MPNQNNILKTKADLLDVELNIAKALRDIVKLQDKEIDNAKKLGIEGKLIEDIKSKQISTEQQILLLNTAIIKKQELWNKLEERRKLFGSNQSDLQLKIGKQIRDATDRVGGLNKQLMRSHGITTLLNSAGFSKMNDFVKELGMLWKANPIQAISLIILGVFEEIFRVFKHIDESAAKFRVAMGTTREFSKEIQESAVNIATEFANLGVSTDNVYNSFLATAKVIGTSQAATNNMVKDISLLSAQLGVAEQTSVEFLKSMGMLGKSTMESQLNILLFTTRLSQAARVPLNDVMNDVLNATKNSYQFMTRSPLALAKASVEAKRMGTSLSDAAKTASSLIQFTSSVKDEMEASVLLGESINLQRARELSYRKDLKGLNEEILRIAKETHFEDLDPFQQEAVAKALGKSASELGTILQAERERQNIARTIAKDPALRKQREELDRMLKSTSSISDMDAERARIQLTQEGNQSRITSISNSWNKIMMELAKDFLPAIDNILGFIANHLGGIIAMSSSLFAFWKGGVKIIEYFGISFGRFSSIFTRVISVLGRISAIAKPVGMIVSLFGKWIPVIGWIITGISLVINLFKRFEGIGKVFSEKGFWAGIVFGLKAIGGAVYDTLIKPFVDVWDWLKKTFFGSSPSELGMLIVNGIKAVESMLIGALLSPFQMAWNLIKQIPFIDKLFGKEQITPLLIKPDITTERPDLGIIRTTAETVQATGKTNVISDQLDSIKVELQNMRKDFANGTIMATVFLDSQKLDSGLARSKTFRGDLSPS